jgi:hypothetical protein
MALGAITPQVCNHLGTTDPAVIGDLKSSITNVVGDGAYSAGGSTITAQQLGFSSTIVSADCQVVVGIAGVITATALIQTGSGSVKLKTFGGTGSTPNIGLVEATGTANQSGATFQIQALGY